MRAAIDLGSNSVLLTVLDADGRVKHDEARVVGLGRGLGDGGVFAEDRMAETLAAVADYAARSAELGIQPGQVRAVTTSAARRASNSEAFFAKVASETGIAFRVIAGEEEAKLTWQGAVADLALEGIVAVVDLGGGSTEIAVGESKLDWRHSYEIGSVRLTERVLGPEVPPASRANQIAMTMRAREIFAAQSLPKCDHVVGVAGTATTLYATTLGQTQYDGPRVHKGRLTKDMLLGFQDRLLGMDREGRQKVFPIAPKRADYLFAGSTILIEALRALDRGAMVISDRGLRYGLLALDE